MRHHKPAAPGFQGRRFYTEAAPKEQGNCDWHRSPAVKLSTKGRYAVMAMADLASRGGGNEPVSLGDIAESQDISLSYLEQLFAKLRKGGLVVSVRGPGGGYRLSRGAAELRIGDIILAVDEPIAVTRCKPGSPIGCTGTAARCITHDLWEELGRQIHVFLSSVTLADVVERRVLGCAHLRALTQPEARVAA
jgi:Rrf2 family iron-sulfur cluster assembly transcriptional regulator